MPGGAKGAYFYKPYPLTIARGEGVYLYDVDGRRYVDFANHHTAQVLGHRHPAVDEAVTQCLLEIAAESDILQHIKSPYVRLAIAWGGALVTSIRKAPRIIKRRHAPPLGPRENNQENAFQPRPRWRPEAGKVKCVQPPSSDDENEV